MAKRITISIPDELFEKIQAAKDEYLGEINTSQICQKALSNAVARFEAHKAYEEEGRTDGAKDMEKLSKSVASRIAYALNGEDPECLNSSTFDVVQYLETRLQFSSDFPLLHPRHTELYEGDMVLHDWLKYGSDMSIEDKKGEVAWTYVEGWYKGVKEAYLEKKGASNV